MRHRPSSSILSNLCLGSKCSNTQYIRVGCDMGDPRVFFWQPVPVPVNTAPARVRVQYHRGFSRVTRGCAGHPWLCGGFSKKVSYLSWGWVVCHRDVAALVLGCDVAALGWGCDVAALAWGCFM